MKLLTILLLVVISAINCSKILFIIPCLTNSVVIQSGRLADLLVEDGHDVTFFIPELVSINKHNGTKLAKVIRLGGFRDHFLEGLKTYFADIMLNRISATYKKLVMADAQIEFCHDLLKRKSEWDYLRNENFDIVFTNNIDFCDIGLAHYIGYKSHIWISTGPLHEMNNYVLGTTQPTSYLPTLEMNDNGPDMTFYEKIYNFAMGVECYFMQMYYKHRVQNIFRSTINENFPDLYELGSKTSLTFVNDLDFLDFPGPTLVKVKNIGGAGIVEPKKLDNEFEKLLQKGSKGVILVSFGSAYNTLNMKFDMRNEMIKSLRNFTDYHFLFKISKNDTQMQLLASNYDNIDLVEWTPQTDILNHKRLKGFITHGGMNSVIEGAVSGVPMVVIPLFFDQFRNARMVEYRNIGVFIKEEELTEKKLTSSLDKIFNDPKYKTNAMRMKQLFKESPNHPDETFLKWTNFVINNGPLPELIPKSVELNIIQYFCIDVIAFILIFPLLISYLSYKMFFVFYNSKN